VFPANDAKAQPRAITHPLIKHEGDKKDRGLFGLAVSAEYVFVSGRTAIHKFTHAGQHVLTTRGGDCQNLNGIAVDDDELFAVDGDLGRVSVYRIDSGAFDRQFGEKGKGDGQLWDPVGIAVNLTHVFITDRDLER